MLIASENMSFGFEGGSLLENITFNLSEGDRVGLIGGNGEGKTTLIRLILGELDPESGSLFRKNGAKIGYLAQTGGYDSEKSVYAEMCDVFESDRQAISSLREIEKKISEVTEGSDEYRVLAAKYEALNKQIAARDSYNYEVKVRTVLNGMGFSEVYDQCIKTMSGGEKTRLKLCRLLLENPELLILDEPTNHLDMKTKDVLKEAIKAFDGTVIVVSHDREFLDGLVEKVYEFGGGRVIENIGGIYDFLNRKRMSNLNELEYRSTSVDEVKPAIDEEKQQRKLSYAEQKEHEKLLKRALKAIKDAELLVEKLDEEKAELEQKLSEGQSDASLLDRYAQVQKQSEEAMLAWEEAQMEYENLNS
jgi:ATP-binding cassette subfamily F protein 3